MPYSLEQPNAWAMPDIQQLLELRERALQQQQQQEPPTPAEMVTAETMQGVNANRDAYNQQQQPYLTPQSAHLLGLIVNNKDAYENADVYARVNNPNEKDEAVLSALANDMRTAAHAGNDRIREQAKAIGLDLNGYENVGYQDAYNTLQDRKAKEIAELMGNTGRYSVSTDQFYNDNYLALIGEGKSAREAKRIAGRRAQEYQADRVTYLRNAFNVHGLDGNYVNGTGVDILNEMAEEMPTVANVYAQAYQLPTQLQDRFNKLKDEDIKQANTLEQIAATGNVNMNLQDKQNAFTRERDTTLFEQTLQRLGIEHGYNQDDITLQYQLSGENARALEAMRQRAENEKPGELMKLFKDTYRFGKANGLSDQEATELARVVGIRYLTNYGNGKGGSKSGEKSDEPKYTEKQNTFLNQAKNLFSMAKEDIGNEENINRFEALIKGVDDVTGLEGDKAVTMLDFPVGVRQELEDWLNALRGGYYKAHADDNKAAEYWSKVRDVAILEKTFPHENFKDYKKTKTLGDKRK